VTTCLCFTSFTFIRIMYISVVLHIFLTLCSRGFPESSMHQTLSDSFDSRFYLRLICVTYLLIG